MFLREVRKAFIIFLLGGLGLGESRADTLSVWFPPSAGVDPAPSFATSTGQSLDGFSVRAGAFAVTPNQLFSSLAGETSEAAIRTTIHSSFTQYGSFTMADAYATDPAQGIVALNAVTGAMGNVNLRGKDIYLLFYNNLDFNAATEMGIFRMAFRDDNPDLAVGVFPTGAQFTGERLADFYLADIDKAIATENYLNLLIGQYDATANAFRLGALAGGIGQITSALAKTNSIGSVLTYQIQANHGPDRYFATTNTSTNDLTVTTLPTGFSISTNTGVITVATNAAAGTYPIRLVASNSLTAVVATNTLTWVLQAATLTFTTTTNLISATAGVEISPFTFVSTGTAPTYSVSSGNLRGLSLSSGGVLSGMPTSVGTNDVVIQASAAGQSATTTFSLAVAAPTIAVPGGDLTGGQLVVTAGTARTSTVTKTANFTNLSGSISPTTTGVSFDGSSLIIGTNALPLAKGTTNVTLTLTATRVGTPVSASTTVPLRIVAPVPTALVGTNEFEVDVGQLFSTSIVTDVGALARMSFSNLPSGLTSFANGTVSGTNTSTNLPFEFVVPVRADSSIDYEGGGVFTSSVTMRLRNTNAPYFAPATNRYLLALGRSIRAVNLQAFNFPFRYTASNLPAGLQLVGANISGTPTAAGRFEVPVVAYNAFRPGSTNPADWQAGSGTLIFHVADAHPPTSVAPTSPGALSQGAAIALTDNRYLLDAASSGVNVAAYGLPPGISLDATTGKIYGTPTSRGTYTATVFIQNGRGWIKKTVTLTVQ